MKTHESPPIRRSIEVEYWVVDSEGYLTTPEGLVEASPGAEREFVKPIVEIKTTPCASTVELRAEFCERIEAVLQRAAERDQELVPIATPITREEIADLSSERTRIQDRVVGPAFDYVRHCAGTHIHVEQQPGRTVDQLNTLIALDPALALLNSARHFDGEAIAAGARSKLYRRLAYADLDGQGRLWPYASSRAEWDQRLTARYEAFIEQATAAGVDRAAVESCFDPESAVWTPVQIRETFGTVEWRSPDATLPSEIIRLADSIAGIVDRLRDAEVRIEGQQGRLGDDEIVLPEFEAVTDYVDRAIREGLAAESVRAYLSRMGFDPAAYEPLAHDLDSERLTPAEARECRLEAAARLREDISEAAATEVAASD